MGEKKEKKVSLTDKKEINKNSRYSLVHGFSTGFPRSASLSTIKRAPWTIQFTQATRLDATVRAGVANETPGISRCSRLPSNDNVHRTNAQWSRKHRDPTVFRKKRILSKHTPLFSRSSTATPRVGVFFLSFFLSGVKSTRHACTLLLSPARVERVPAARNLRGHSTRSCAIKN